VKKFYTIFLAILILLGGMHISFATHYCGGKFAASKISVSGEHASCGMEGTEASCPSPGDHFKRHCCDDEMSVYSIDNTYTPSFTDLSELSQNILQVFTLRVSDTLNAISTKDSLLTNVCPPGIIFTSAVSLVDICVFRT
jgi:hypothetical protein